MSDSRVRVWDLPLRLFHVLLLICVAVALVTAQLGGNWMTWHVRAGASTVGLLLFRAIWGFVGPRYARFHTFLYPPRQVLACLKPGVHASMRHAGHNPAGAVSVFAMLLVLLAESVSGLFSSDAIATEGALVRFGSDAAVSTATSLHVALQWAVYALIALHLLAIFGRLLLKREDLIRPMLSGDKYGIDAEPAMDTPMVRGIGLALASLLIAGSIWLLT